MCSIFSADFHAGRRLLSCHWTRVIPQLRVVICLGLLDTQREPGGDNCERRREDNVKSSSRSTGARQCLRLCRQSLRETIFLGTNLFPCLSTVCTWFVSRPYDEHRHIWFNDLKGHMALLRVNATVVFLHGWIPLHLK
jgi:hypothetical protein